MNGTELAVRFSYITNSLRFCGPKEAQDQFLKYLDNKDNEIRVQELLLKFESLRPYITQIAEKVDKDCFYYDVMEAYWIGNNLLEKFNDIDMKEIILKLVMRGLPKSTADKLLVNLPSGLVPHHNFNVMYVGVGSTTKSVENNIQNMDNCRISWGKVLEVQQEKLIVSSKTLKKNDEKKFYLGEEETKTAIYQKKMLPTVKKDDTVALHWGFAPLILSNVQLNNLEKYTKKIIDVLN